MITSQDMDSVKRRKLLSLDVRKSFPKEKDAFLWAFQKSYFAVVEGKRAEDSEHLCLYTRTVARSTAISSIAAA